MLAVRFILLATFFLHGLVAAVAQILSDKSNESTLSELVPRGSEQPSFNCAQAKTAAARLICADGVLARLDGVLGNLFRARKAFIPAADRSKFVASQIAWIRRRNESCALKGKDTASIEVLADLKPCVATALRERIENLEKEVANAASNPPSSQGSPAAASSPAPSQSPLREQWKRLESETGLVVAIDLGSIHRDGARDRWIADLKQRGELPPPNFDTRPEFADANVCIEVEDNKCSPFKLRQFRFDCHGHYRDVQDFYGPMMIAPPRSVAGLLAAIACGTNEPPVTLSPDRAAEALRATVPERQVDGRYKNAAAELESILREKPWMEGYFRAMGVNLRTGSMLPLTPAEERCKQIIDIVSTSSKAPETFEPDISRCKADLRQEWMASH